MQVTSLVIIAVFFAAWLRSSRRSELKWWVAAWACNAAALAISLTFWALRPSEAWYPLVKVLYMTPKTIFVLLLLQGAWALKRPGARLFRARHVVPALVIYSLYAAFAVGGIPDVGMTQHVVMGLLFAVGSVMLLIRPVEAGLTWLAGGFLARSLLAFVEAGAYSIQGATGDTGGTLPTYVSKFLAAHSSFDSGTEWLIALGCVLALSERIQRELRQSNTDLLTAQEDLRQLVDQDPLTGLANRRSLRDILRTVQPQGATLLFFDLDEFKAVNDVYGHRTGDESLKRFATALAQSFREHDVLVRYAGDEFLVVALGLDENAVQDRVARLREKLKRTREPRSPRLAFSVGVSVLEPGGDPDAALEAADASMYRDKNREPAAS